MNRFLTGDEAAFADLETRATSEVVVFGDALLPPGATPARARAGFHIEAGTGAALLYVDRGVTYSGRVETVRRWLTSGTQRFRSFAELRIWLESELAPCFPGTFPRVGQDSLGSRVDRESPVPTVAGLGVTPQDTASRARACYVDEARLLVELRKRVRGQDGALRRLSERVCRHLAREAPRRPATLFAVGPTGVGKTSAAESLATALRSVSGGEAAFDYLRLDMNEYQEAHRVSQLLGAPQGYLGYGEGARILDALRANPRTIVLFDEIEKAHPSILLTLMNAMDAGRLSAPSGAQAVVDCRSAVFLFTSNLASEGILAELNNDAPSAPTRIDDVCRRHAQAGGIAPELVGRIGCFLVFRPLTERVLSEIAVLAMVRVGEEYGLRIHNVEPAVIRYLTGQMRGTTYGVRPVEYQIDRLLGGHFSRAARNGRSRAVKVTGGPPFVVLPFRAEPEPGTWWESED